MTSDLFKRESSRLSGMNEKKGTHQRPTSVTAHW